MLLTALLLSLAPQAEYEPGFTLYSAEGSQLSHLVDEEGVTVHTWSSDHAPGLATYLKPNGNLLRMTLTSFEGGGIEERTWDSELVWEFRYETNGNLSHHDIELMPNGNVLVIAYEVKARAEAIAAGRNPATLGQQMAPDHIIEVEPTPPSGGIIVWEWHAWDHLVQDFDPTKAYHGDPAEHPELIDVNYPPGYVEGFGDWTHCNSVDYNPELDQILISSRTFCEIWIIDHSTTTAEAAGHSGGNSGRGGDLLWRWGNVAAYQKGDITDRTLFTQHDANWVEPGFPGEGNIVVFNNGVGRGHSSADEIAPPVDAQGNYALNAQGIYDPPAATWSYTAPGLYSEIEGGAVRLENGNTLICEAVGGNLFEADQAHNLVWQHGVPGFFPIVFKVRRYGHFLFVDHGELSAGTGGRLGFRALAGSANAGRSYVLFGASSGTEPGTPLPGGLATLPLNQDLVTDFILANLGGPGFAEFTGTLDATGAAEPVLDTLGPVPSSLVGETLHFAFALSRPWDFASNAVAVEVTP